MQTIRRNYLLKLARAGQLIKIESYHFDDMQGQEISKKEMPVRVKKDHADFIEGQCNLWASDFESRCGSAWRNPNGTISLHVHSNCHFTFKLAAGAEVKPVKLAKAKRPENKLMQDFLLMNGIDAVPKWLADGSMKHCWRLYNPNLPWTLELAAKLTALGFVSAHNEPLGRYNNNGGMLSICVRGRSEFVTQAQAATLKAVCPLIPAQACAAAV